MITKEIRVVTRNPHKEQERFLKSTAKRKIIKAGRRAGKTVGVSIAAVDAFIDGRRVLYAAPTSEQTDRFWHEVTRALHPLIDTGLYKLNETERFIEKVGTLNRIKAKTAWNANTLRGDYADLLIFDEYQLTSEDAWEEVGAPMLLDNNGDAIFIYTPPSLKSTGVSKARDPRHASKMFKMAQNDRTGDWQAFHFTSYDNPLLPREALEKVTQDMSRESYLKEIMAEDDEQANLLVYGAFNETVCLKERFEIPKEWQVYSGHDFGSANPAALFAAVDPMGNVWCFHEYRPPSGKSAFQNVQSFKEIAEGLNVINRVGGSHQEEDSRDAYSLQGWPIAEPFVNKVNVQVDRVKQLMEKNKIFVFSDLHHLIEELNTCLWKLDENGKPTDVIKDEKRFHLLACLRYLCSIFNPIVEKKAGGGGIVIERGSWAR